MTPEQIKTILDAHYQWLQSGEGTKANLSGADLYSVDLSGANLYSADLIGANLIGANLSGANLYSADLSGADLIRADLYSANLYSANLSGANLSGANLIRADLYSADLSGANLYSADLIGANLIGANLSGATINWRDHQTVSELLLRAAEDNVPRRMIAGLIRVSTDWCWKQFLAIDHPEKEWALSELKKWVKDGDTAPINLKGTTNENQM